MDAPIELLRAARSALGLRQDQLAELTGISARTILKIEKSHHVKVETMRRLQAGFEELGVRFLGPADGSGPGIRLPIDFSSEHLMASLDAILESRAKTRAKRSRQPETSS
jgi:transcriptional regulator with XRE-family HTH domain